MQQVADAEGGDAGSGLHEISHCRSVSWERMLSLVSLGVRQGQLGLDTLPEAPFSRRHSSCRGKDELADSIHRDRYLIFRHFTGAEEPRLFMAVSWCPKTLLLPLSGVQS